jgi:plasmid stabilization system protein ParE
VKLRYTKTALHQIEQALSFIRDRTPQGAARVAMRTETVLAVLLDYPHAGQRTDYHGVRRVALTPYPYVIFYRATPAEIIVMRFRHTARKPR